MKSFSILVAILALSLFVGVASAAKGNKHQGVNGIITAIDGANITIQPNTPKGTTEKPAPLTIVTNASTAVTFDEEKKNVTDLAVGQHVKVSLDTDGKTALTITVKIKSEPKPEAAPAAPATPPAPAVDPAK